LYLGWIAAFLAGLVIPGFCWFVGNIADTFNPYVQRETPLLAEIKIYALIQVMIGFGVLITTSTYYSLL
jgi:hypothetical protein